MITAILGGADGVWEELDSLMAMEPGCVDFIVAVNEAGRDYTGHYDVWATLHTEKLAIWLEDRRRIGERDPDMFYIPNEVHLRLTQRMDIPPAMVHVGADLIQNGSSGLFAVEVARRLRPENRIVLCGIPMDGAKGHYFSEGPWTDAENYRWAWFKAVPKLTTIVRSMSGWTQEILGRPDTAWINQERSTDVEGST